MITIYYLGIEEKKKQNQEAGRERFFLRELRWRFKQKKEAFPIMKLKEALRYEGGEVQVFFCLLPSWEEGKHRKKLLQKRFLLTLEKMRTIKEHNLYEDMIMDHALRQIFGITKTAMQLPLALYGVCVREQRRKTKTTLQKDRISLSLPEDGGQLLTDNVLEILEPYLPRINEVIYVGEESEQSIRIEDYLLEEYGIVVSYSAKPRKNTMWIDLQEKKDEKIERYVSENGVYHLNSIEVRKFLDTTVKNGYNTKVN